MGIVVAVCGGRDYSNRDTVDMALRSIDENEGISRIVTGGCRGADKLAEEWSDLNVVDLEVYEANWELYGKSAGPRRNQDIIDLGKPDLLLAFPGGRGTKDMTERAFKSGIPVAIVDEVTSSIVFLSQKQRPASRDRGDRSVP